MGEKFAGTPAPEKRPRTRTTTRRIGTLATASLRTTYAVACREIKGMSKDPNPNPEKPTDQWVTGQEPMTGPQISYLQTLCREAGEEFDGSMTKAEASKKIEELQAKTGRGKGS
jgi:Protein of unknown function (DUF3072)